MNILLHEFYSHGHSLHGLCLLLGSRAWRETCSDPQLQVTLLLPDVLEQSLRREMGSEVFSPCRVKTFPAEKESGSWRARWVGARHLRNELKTGTYQRVIVLAGDLLGLFAPFIHFSAKRSEIYYQVYRVMFCYREAGYPTAGYTGRRFWGPLVKNRLMLLYQRLGWITGFLFEDEAAAAWCDRRNVPSRLIRIPGVFPGNIDHKPSERLRFTLFGVLSSAKHTAEVFRAWGRLPEDLRSHASLQVIGKTLSRDQNQIETAYAAVQDESVSYEDRYLEDHEVETLLGETDVLINIYSPEHVGCSAVLIQAALCQIPVLVANRGWVGYMTRVHGLGMVLEDTSEKGILRALNSCISTGLQQDTSKSESFVRPYLGEAYAESLCSLFRGKS